MVEFKLGHLNATADTLSHRDDDTMTLHILSLPEFELYDHFHREAASLSEKSPSALRSRRAQWDQTRRSSMPSSYSKAATSYHRRQTCWCRCYNRPMAWATGEFRRRSISSELLFSCCRTIAKSVSSSSNTLFANATKQSTFTRWAYSSRSPCRAQDGSTLPWILLKAFQNWAASRWC
jgi:hypothetical protein